MLIHWVGPLERDVRHTSLSASMGVSDHLALKTPRRTTWLPLRGRRAQLCAAAEQRVRSALVCSLCTNRDRARRAGLLGCQGVAWARHSCPVARASPFLPSAFVFSSRAQTRAFGAFRTRSRSCTGARPWHCLLRKRRPERSQNRKACSRADGGPRF